MPPFSKDSGRLTIFGIQPSVLSNSLHSIVYACLLLSGIFTKSAYCPQQSWVLNLPTPRGWKAEPALSLVGFEPTVIVGSLTVLKTVFIDGPQLGVFCTETILKGIRFGPFQGKVVNTSEIKTYDDNSLMWEIFEDGQLSHFIDGRGSSGNWMSLVNCARFPEEQNLTALQCQDQIYYESCKEITPGQELLVWYGDCYSQFLGIPISLKGTAEEKRTPQRSEDFMFPAFCFWDLITFLSIPLISLQAFTASSILRTHIRQHSGEKPFKCKHCGKVFASHAAHDSHVRRTHSSKDKGSKCTLCDKIFLEAEEFRFHMKFHKTL
uniref:PR/SET domain 14 n=1 Tax=Naja naja TaxID=35670 RepID=A0A8C6XJP7_NAJNA